MRVLMILLLIPFLSWGQDNTMLYKLEKDGQTLYIFGTMHILTEQYYNLDKTVTKALKKSDTLFLETTDMEDPKVQVEMMQMLKLPANQTLKDLIRPTLYDSLTQYFKQNHPLLPFEKLEKQHPFLITQMLTMMEIYGKKTYQLESELTKLAKANKQPTVGFESALEQLGFIDSLGYNEMLVSLIEEGDSQTSLEDLMKVYATCDTTKMSEMGGEMNSEMEDILLNQRNEKWIQVISKSTGDNFIAVGALHLLGKNGLLIQLQKLGYTITPIKPKHVIK